jgi:eukaryotic-like serine/threonine-protein kinase
LLADRYRLVRPLARGGMGSVWTAEHLTLGSEVAIKIIDPRVASRDMGVARFLREARALAALRSPYIVQVMDFGTDGEIVFLVMELLEGRTLGQRLKAEGKLSASETNRILSQVCKAMSHAHGRGIIHRDLKPDNIYVCDQTREHVTKVLDFGIAKPLGGMATSGTSTEVGAFLGTPSYMSPEQCRGSTDIDHRSDLWSLGAIAYECLLGRRLFEGEVLGELVVRICTEALPIASTSSQLPTGFAEWLSRAMARSPADRFQSAAELGAALSAVLESAGESSRGVDSAETLQEERFVAALAPAAGLGSTLENGSLAQATGQPRASKRFSLKLAVASVAILVVLAVVALIRSGAPASRATQAVAPREVGQTPSASPLGATASAAAPAPAPASAARDVSETNANEAAPDGGVSTDAERKNVSPRAPVTQQPRKAPHSVAVPAARGTVAPDAPEVEVLRRKR